MCGYYYSIPLCPISKHSSHLYKTNKSRNYTTTELDVTNKRPDFLRIRFQIYIETFPAFSRPFSHGNSFCRRENKQRLRPRLWRVNYCAFREINSTNRIHSEITKRVVVGYRLLYIGACFETAWFILQTIRVPPNARDGIRFVTGKTEVLLHCCKHNFQTSPEN